APMLRSRGSRRDAGWCNVDDLASLYDAHEGVLTSYSCDSVSPLSLLKGDIATFEDPANLLPRTLVGRVVVLQRPAAVADERKSAVLLFSTGNDYLFRVRIHD